MKSLEKIIVSTILLLFVIIPSKAQLASNSGSITMTDKDWGDFSVIDDPVKSYNINVTPGVPIKITYQLNTYDFLNIITNGSSYVYTNVPTNGQKSFTVVSTSGTIVVACTYMWGDIPPVIFTLNYQVDQNYSVSDYLNVKKDASVVGKLGVGILVPREKLDVIGNSLISGRVAIGGTSMPQSLNVYGNSYLSGNLGLGTQGDGSKLAVNGDVHVGILNNGNFSYGNKLAFMGADDSGWDPLWMARYSESQDHTQLRMNIGDNTTGDDKFIVGNTVSGDVTKTWNPHFTVQNNDKIGIGTATPNARLDIAADITNQFGVIFGRLPEGNTTNDGTFLGVRGYGTQPINSNSFAIEHHFFGKINSSINFFRGADSTSGFITFNTKNTERMRIQNTGQVSIGTSDLDLTPHVMLSVKGSIHTREVIIDYKDALADFVFKPDYKLMPLHEVKKYVSINNHLPEIPSAKEVAEKGMNVSEMQNKMLQKIEELTLYVIAQQEEINALKQKLK